MPTSQMLPIEGAELYVEDTGETDLPAVVCLHSLFLDGRMFDGLVEAAAGRYRVVRPDFRGQGRSPKTNADFIDMDTCAGDVIKVIESLGVGPVHLVVQSMGGDVAWRVATKRPDLVKSMVIMGSSARNEPPEQLETFRQWVNDVGEKGFVGDTLDTTMAIMFGTTTMADPGQQSMLALWRERIGGVPRTLRPAMSGVIERGNMIPELPKIKVPVLVISGREDLPRPPEWQDEMVNALPNVEFMRLEGIGHSVILEAPDVVISRTLGFLDSVDANA